MMTVLVSIGPAGLSLPITFANLVRTHLGFGLRNAKEVLDELTTEKHVIVAFEERLAAAAFCAEVAGLGLITDDVPDAPTWAVAGTTTTPTRGAPAADRRVRVGMSVLVAIGPAGLVAPNAFADLVRTHLGLPSSEAQQALDELTTEKHVVLAFTDRGACEAFRTEVAALGLVARDVVAAPTAWRSPPPP